MVRLTGGRFGKPINYMLQGEVVIVTTDNNASIHEQLTDVNMQLAVLSADVKSIKAACAPCREEIKGHDRLLRGNGRDGLLSRITRLETSRVDTLSVASICKLFGAASAMAAAIGAAMAAVIP